MTMNFWTVGFPMTMLELRRAGCTPRDIGRLVGLKCRYERGEFDELELDRKRLRFARWLVRQGRLSDALPAAG